MQETTMSNEQKREHPASDIDVIVVDEDDVVETMQRNRRDENEQRSHVLRVTPPFAGEKRAKTHVSENHTHYPPDMDPKPLHFGPEAFLVGHSAGSRHSEWRDEWRHPNIHEQKSLFRDEYDAHGEDGGNRELTDDEEEKWTRWWDTAVEMWESEVRHALGTTDQLTLTSQHPNVSETTVYVRVETDE
jgi:hypothetical protein